MFAARRGIVPAVVLAWLVGFPSAGQQAAPPPGTPAPTANPPEIATHDVPVTFRTRVNLVSIPVVVRDSAGRAVGALKQQDFQLFDKGKPQVIEKFSIEKPGTPTISAESALDENAPAGRPAAPAPPIADRFVAYVFDDVHLTASDLLRTRQAAERHLEEIENTSRVAIFTTSGGTTLDFTDNRDQVRETLRRIQPWTSTVHSADNCPPVTYFQADLIVNQNDDQALAAASSDAVTLTCVHPATQQQLTDPKQLQVLAQIAAQQAAHVALAAGDEETRVSMSVLRDVVGRITAAPGSRSLILVSPGFFLTIDHRREENDLLDRAIRGNVVISTLNARGVYNPDQITDPSQRSPDSSFQVYRLKSQYQRDSALADEDILGELASGTGGAYFFNSNDFVLGLKQIAARPEFVYVLGFSPQNLKYDGSYHTVKVALSPRGLNLQARRGYFAPKHEIDPEQEARDEIREALFSREEMTELPIDLNMQFFKASESNARLSVTARVKVKQLPFRKAEDRNSDNLTITSAIFDRNGNLITGSEKMVEMKLKDQSLAGIPEVGISIRSNFDVAPGAYVVRLVVRDSEGQLMAAKNGTVQIP